jgi:hypothetical protein
MEIHGENEVAGKKFAYKILTLRDRLFFGLMNIHIRPIMHSSRLCELKVEIRTNR